jgi:pilus assembly protein Flp/PilA
VQFEAPTSSLNLRLGSLWQDDDGQDIVEYALIALAMGLSTVAGVHGLANSISGDLNFIVNGFNNATGY